MDIRIGVNRSGKELEIELPEGTDAEEFRAQVETALTAGAMLWLTDRRGRRVGLPAGQVAWIEIEAPDRERRIGFGS